MYRIVLCVENHVLKKHNQKWLLSVNTSLFVNGCISFECFLVIFTLSLNYQIKNEKLKKNY